MATTQIAEDLNPFHTASKQFDNAAQILNLDSGMCALLRSPKRQLIVSIPTRMDDGSIHVFEGYRVQHSIARGPAQGGIRYHPNVTLDEVNSTASKPAEPVISCSRESTAQRASLAVELAPTRHTEK